MIIARNQSRCVSLATGRSFTRRRSLDYFIRKVSGCETSALANRTRRGNRSASPDPLSLLVQSSRGAFPN